ncbi:unnamed protein product [Alopecurus aequalis]
MSTGQDARGGVGEEKGRREKVELLQEAIHGLLEKNKVKQQQQQHGEEEGSMVPRDQEEDLLLSSLLAKLNTLEKDVDLDDAEVNSLHEDLESRKEVGLGDIAKDLNKIKRQNMITHILLGTLMVMTAVWQFGEVSFLLGVQKKLTDPFKSFGDIFNRTLKRGEQTMNEVSPLPPVSIPDVTDLPALAIGDGDS